MQKVLASIPKPNPASTPSGGIGRGKLLFDKLQKCPNKNSTGGEYKSCYEDDSRKNIGHPVANDVFETSCQEDRNSDPVFISCKSNDSPNISNNLCSSDITVTGSKSIDNSLVDAVHCTSSNSSDILVWTKPLPSSEIVDRTLALEKQFDEMECALRTGKFIKNIDVVCIR